MIACLDLGQSTSSSGNIGGGLLVAREPDSNTRFKILTEDKSLYLKAESREQRELWIQAIAKHTTAALANSSSKEDTTTIVHKNKKKAKL